MKYIPNSRITIITLVILIVVSAVIVFASTQSQQEIRQISKDIRVENKTNSLVVESIKEIRKQKRLIDSTDSVDSRTFEVKLRNNSKKPIVNFSLTINDASTNENTSYGIERGGMMGEWSLMPNEIDVNRFSAASKGEVVLTVAAVLFDDGTEEGETAELLRLRENRTGIKLAYQQIAQILRRNINLNKAVDSKSAIQTLEKELVSISDEKVPMNQKRGFRQAKDFFISELQDIKNKMNSESNRLFGSESEKNLAYSSEINEQLAKIEKAIAHF